MFRWHRKNREAQKNELLERAWLPSALTINPPC